MAGLAPGYAWRFLDRNRSHAKQQLIVHGWTSEDLDEVQRILGPATNKMLGVVNHVCQDGHYPDRSPQVVLAWLRLAHAQNIRSDEQTRTVWHGVLGPGLLAPLAYGVGLSLSEAVAQRDAGTLTLDSVRALAALRGLALD